METGHNTLIHKFQVTDTWKFLTVCSGRVVKMINVLKKTWHKKKKKKKKSNLTCTRNAVDIFYTRSIIQNSYTCSIFHVLCIFITFIPDDDHRNLQIEVTLAPALRCALGRAYFSFQDRFTQPDGLLERFSTIQTEHHHEQVSCDEKFDQHILHFLFFLLFSIIPKDYFAREG